METMMAAVAIKDPAVVVGLQKPNRIQVSTNKKPVYFYVNLAKRFMERHNEVELSALGMAIGTVVTVAEILKNNGLATEKKIMTSTVGTKDEAKGRLVRKAKIEILLSKTQNSSDLITTAKTERSANSNATTAKAANKAGEEARDEDGRSVQEAEEISE
ncbi:uncharacterized protein At2g34160 [Dendrobium catenatum]|uniref:DNA/RNA-binding protein Alba-like domain-containing protein n=1 Tax=Dendrobium catenatum TaxID=906689 RepID=A0A2I0WRA5_9ASPA|nr:uncharacterized protein At2g34160 [Dendrobium catenatum]PKU78194.1 Uncharacterized protein MA16_Dca012314 [Dendrobium catenatum]